MLRELVTRPIGAVVALIELPGTVQRSLKQANELMESSRRQLEAMQRQTDQALQQAERMNDLLGRVVKLTEPLEMAQRGGEYVGGRLKRALFGEEPAQPREVAGEPVAGANQRDVAEGERTAAQHASSAEYAVAAPPAAETAMPEADAVKQAAERLERAADDAEEAVRHAELAAGQAESAAEVAEEEATEARGAPAEAGVAAEDAGEVDRTGEAQSGWKPAVPRRSDGGGVEVSDSATIRVIPNQPPPEGSQQ